MAITGHLSVLDHKPCLLHASFRASKCQNIKKKFPFQLSLQLMGFSFFFLFFFGIFLCQSVSQSVVYCLFRFRIRISIFLFFNHLICSVEKECILVAMGRAKCAIVGLWMQLNQHIWLYACRCNMIAELFADLGFFEFERRRKGKSEPVFYSLAQ